MTGTEPQLLNGRYEVLKIAGRGGEGTVLHAVDRRHDRHVALKVRAKPTRPDESERALLEARTLLSLRPHGGLPLARDDFFEGDHHVLVLDWVEGVDLATMLVEHGHPGLPVATVLRWLAPVAEALTHLHNSDPPIVHGDVKPANIILTPSGQVVLVDFGMSSTADVAARGGTPGFRAPDLVRGTPPTRAVDVYALAATAFTLLTGAPPEGVMPTWTDLEPARAAALQAALRRGLATDPARRTATPGELVEELRAGWEVEGLPTGVLSFAATELVMAAPSMSPAVDAAAAVGEHQLLIDSIVERWNGRRFGDGAIADTAMLVFHRGDDALEAAVELQRASIDAGRMVRCAVHIGEASATTHGYSGPTVTTVSRIRDIAKPGEVLLSGAAADVARSWLPAGTGLLELGAHRLFGQDHPELLFALDAEGLVVPPDPNVSPYPGLAAFQPADSDLFFGREETAAELAGRLGPGKVTGVVGASGSGKSSLLRAGVVPLLGNATVITPTAHPMQQVAAVHDGPLVVDQLEEMFTLCDDEAERQAFAEFLCQHPGGALIAIRGDEYARLVEFPSLAAAVAGDHVLLGPLPEDQLRVAVERPAQLRGLALESGLVELVLAEAAAEPGALPHIAHALRETWLRREGRLLTVAGYQSTGGVRGALVQTAEHVYDALTEGGQEVLQSVLLRMVEPGDGVPDVRRKVALDDLDRLGARDDVRAVVLNLADARLITIEQSTAEPAHEALLRDWPRLRTWIDDARDDLRLQRNLATAASEWVRRGRDRSDLYRGSRLAAASEWMAAHGAELAPEEREFILAGESNERSELLAAQRSARRLRSLLIGVAILLALAVVAGGLALVQRNRANHQTQVAVARGLAAQAIAATPTQIDTALLLAAEGYQRDASVDTETGLLTALNGARFMVRSHLPLPANIDDLAITPDQRTLVVLTLDGELAKFDPVTWERIGDPIVTGIESPYAVNTSHDGTMISYGALDGVHVVRTSDGSPIGDTVEGDQGIIGLFSDDDSKIITSFQGDNKVHVNEVETGIAVGEIAVEEGAYPVIDVRPGHDEIAIAPFNRSATVGTYRLDGSVIHDPIDLGARNTILGLGYSKDGEALSIGLAGGAMDLLDPSTLEATAPAFTVRGSRIGDVSFSFDHARVGVGSDDGSIRIVSVADGRVEATIAGLDGGVLVEFLDDHRLLAAAGSEAVEYDLDRATAIGDTTHHDQEIRDIVASASGTTAFTVEDQRVVELGADLRDRDRTLATPDVKATTVALSADDKLVAVETFTVDPTGEHIEEGFINIIELGSKKTLVRFAPLGDEIATRMEFSPDGSTLAIVTRSGNLVLFDTATGDTRLGPIAEDREILLALRWSKDGSSLYVGGQAGMLREIDAGTGTLLREVPLTPTIALTDIDPIPNASHVAVSSESGQVFVVDTTTFEHVGQPMTSGGTQLQAVSISNDGTTVAAISRDGALRLWNLASRSAIGPSLLAHDLGSFAVTFIGQGADLLSAGMDGSVVAWDLEPASWLARACSMAGRNLTVDEWSRYMPGKPYHRTCAEYPAAA